MTTLTSFDIQPGALLASAPASATIEQLNAELQPHGLCLPVFPLVPGLTLAELMQRNAGGRRRLRYGPIGRYGRAAVIDAAGEALTLGGPTIKRSTGYGLNRAIAGGGLELGPLRELTFSLRPLPASRAQIELACADLVNACRLAAHLLAAGLALSALAVAETERGAGLLLVELEGVAAVVGRQTGAVAQLAAAADASPVYASQPWARFEQLALAHCLPGAPTLDVTLPRVALADFVKRAQTMAARYRFELTIWGDAGVGALHLRLVAPGGAALDENRRAEAAQLFAVLQALATQAGGSPSTEWGRVAPTSLGAVVVQRPIAPPSGDVLAELRAVVGERYLLTRPEDVSCYETDASIARPDGAALAVALPNTTAEVAELVRVAAAHGLAVVTRGAGSGLAGGATPNAGALLVSLNRLEQISIDRAQMTARVGAGAITAEVQKAAAAAGLLYPPDPSSQVASTIGGNLACNAGGPRCVKYGVTADYLLAVTAVLADGSVVHWGDGLVGQGPANSLAQLLVGSEGTLAIITEATLRLLPAPPARRTTMALFERLEAACLTVEQIMAAGIVPASLELMDDTTIAAVNAYLQLGLPEEAGALLLMLADGEPEEVEADAARLAELARAGGAWRVETAASTAEEASLWQARRAVSIALARVRPNRLGEDISVPLPQIASCVREIKQISAAHGLPIVVFGHAGDGNLHPNILFDAADSDEVARLWPCAEAVFEAALAAGGTLSGEHGIGTLKRPFMLQALGAAGLAVQRQIKAQLDPQDLLNPGKLLP